MQTEPGDEAAERTEEIPLPPPIPVNPQLAELQAEAAKRQAEAKEAAAARRAQLTGAKPVDAAQAAPALSLEAKIDEAKRDSRRRQIRLALITVAAISALALLIWGLFFSSLLAYQVEQTKVSGGGKIVSKAQITKVTEAYAGRSLLRISTGNIADRIVKDVPWVRKAEVSRNYLHGLDIQLTLRTAVARTDGNKALVDTTGKTIPPLKLDAKAEAQIVQLVGAKNEAAIKAGAHVAVALPAGLRAQVQTVDVTNPDMIIIKLKDNRTLKWGSIEESDIKAKVAPLLLTQPGPIYSVIDPRRPVTSTQ